MGGGGRVDAPTWGGGASPPLVPFRQRAEGRPFAGGLVGPEGPERAAEGVEQRLEPRQPHRPQHRRGGEEAKGFMTDPPPTPNNPKALGGINPPPWFRESYKTMGAG